MFVNIYNYYGVYLSLFAILHILSKTKNRQWILLVSSRDEKEEREKTEYTKVYEYSQYYLCTGMIDKG